MDPINERKMFQQLVRAASQLNTPQLVTIQAHFERDMYLWVCSMW
jgi:structural maintenance of chromosomes protein 5